MKKILLKILGCILVLLSLCLVLYPFISNYLNDMSQSSDIVAYDEKVQTLSNDELEAALEAARGYNRSIFGNVTIQDPFDPDFLPVEDEVYESILNFNGDGVMCYLEIPVIGVYLPVRHGTSDEVLAAAVGHLQNTSLPVGGVGTHAVLTGHTGLSSARLFTDINQLVEGDVFYIHVLNETLAYEVDQIKIVLPYETDDLQIDPDEDYVTLVTCTPYGLNTHRLLVRGKRTTLEEAEEKSSQNDRKVESTWMLQYRRALMAGAALLAAFIIFFVIFKMVRRRRKRKKSVEGG